MHGKKKDRCVSKVAFETYLKKDQTNTHAVISPHCQCSLIKQSDNIIRYKGRLIEMLSHSVTFLYIVFSAQQFALKGIDFSVYELKIQHVWLVGPVVISVPTYIPSAG